MDILEGAAQRRPFQFVVIWIESGAALLLTNAMYLHVFPFIFRCDQVFLGDNQFSLLDTKRNFIGGTR